MYIEIAHARIYPAAVLMTSMAGSLFSPVYAADPPRKQDFVVTAYYSPVPHQCCYVRGSYEEEVLFNGQGKEGADGTPVYPGMIAAPVTYDFGTVIALPGLGVATVHDRGSRITEWGDDIHRIDLWMGVGEEGLARAMTWGVRRLSGTIYPVGGKGMPRENFSLDQFNADTAMLAGLPKTDTTLTLSRAVRGAEDYSSRLLQSTLKDLGYFDHKITGEFGTVTQGALKAFLADLGLPGDGSAVSELTAAALTAAMSIKPANVPDVAVGLARGRRGNDVRQVQKLLRFLGFYRGRTDGVFDAHLKASVTAFQLSRGVVTQALEKGAGRVGPATQAAIVEAWKSKIIASKARAVMARMHVAAKVKSEKLPSKVLATGDSGQHVKRLQTFLRESGYLNAKSVTGIFGSRTRAALLQYQLDRKIIASPAVHGAGVFGPSTRMAATQDAVGALWRQVRAEGMRTIEN